MPGPVSASAPAPIIVLFEPQLGENIGMCARAMLNCGLDRLRLVRPRDGWPNPAAAAAAADADRVIENVECFDSLDEAIGECHLVFATTARNRGLPIPCQDLAGAVEEIVTSDRQSQPAILFGPEASGFDNAALSYADRLIRIPTNPDFPSLNLAQAVLLFSWEWRRVQEAPGGENSAPPAGSPPAKKSDLIVFLNRLEEALDEKGFFLTPELRPTTVGNLRALFSRTNPSDEELRMLHGVLTALKKD